MCVRAACAAESIGPPPPPKNQTRTQSAILMQIYIDRRCFDCVNAGKRQVVKFSRIVCQSWSVDESYMEQNMGIGRRDKRLTIDPTAGLGSFFGTFLEASGFLTPSLTFRSTGCCCLLFLLARRAALNSKRILDLLSSCTWMLYGWIAPFLLLHFSSFFMLSSLWLFFSGLSNPQDAEHLTAMVGDSIIFNCHIEFPEAHPVPYVIQWEKKVCQLSFMISYSFACHDKTSLFIWITIAVLHQLHSFFRLLPSIIPSMIRF